ncbi:MAG TPA: SBBP repeat-containing protein, partial [Blastocatellia bacterium]|nr:SBBP repeat-containing protein [Blastocatellia bacterium]
MRTASKRRLATTALAVVTSVFMLNFGFLTASRASPYSLTYRQPRAIATSQIATDAASIPSVAPGGIGTLPISFEANCGQTDSKVKFISRTAEGTAFITGREAIMTTQAAEPTSSLGVHKPHLANAVRAGTTKSGPVATVLNPTESKPARVCMKLARSNPNPMVEGLDQTPGKINYFLGQDPARWRTNIPTFATVRERNVYPGIDLVYHGAQASPGQLEYDFVVAPGANAGAIDLRYEGTSNMRLEAGDLVLRTSGGEIRQIAPVAYQQVGNVRRQVASKYEIKGKGRRSVCFRLGTYDHGLPLVIDPALVYSTYFGGHGFCDVHAVTVDSLGNAYLTGTAVPEGLPATPGAFGESESINLAFVTKLDPTGTQMVYSSLFGSTGTHSAAYGATGYGIAVDATGNVYVTGGTETPDFPVTPGAFQTTLKNPLGAAFVVKLDSTGSQLLYSTYLGGSSLSKLPNGGSRYDVDSGSRIAVGPTGIAYVAGMAHTRDFPTTAGALQPIDTKDTQAVQGGGFVTALNSTGTGLVYSTFLDAADPHPAGTPTESYDLESLSITGLATDSDGNAYISGTTGSPSFPTTPGSFQPTRYGVTALGGSTVFVAKLNPSGSSLVYSTYLGDSSGYGYGDESNSLAVDADGSAYVTGGVDANDFPSVNSFQNGIAGAMMSKTSDGGVTMVNLLDGLPARGSVSINPVVDPSNPSKVYLVSRDDSVRTVGSVAKGTIYRTTDGGGSWSKLGNGLPPNLGVLSIALDPVNPSTLYAGVGGALPGGQPSGTLFKSIDGGDTWTQLSTAVDGSNIAVDPKTPSTLYASRAGHGVLGGIGSELVKSTNGGLTWRPATLGLGPGTINTLVIDPQNTSNLYAGTTQGLFRSTNGGRNWDGTHLGDGIKSISIDPRHPSALYAVAAKAGASAQSDGTGHGNPRRRIGQNLPVPNTGVFTSTDGGANWIAINEGLMQSPSLNVVVVDPNDSSNVYLGSREGLFKWNGIQWAAVPSVGNKATLAL